MITRVRTLCHSLYVASMATAQCVQVLDAASSSAFQICDLLRSGATLVWDNEQMVPYAYKNDQWVGFDDQRSLKLKVSS